MISDSEKFLNNLNSQQQNLYEIMKIELDEKKLKELEKEINKINNVVKCLTQYINYYKVREGRKKL